MYNVIILSYNTEIVLITKSGTQRLLLSPMIVPIKCIN